MIDILDPEVVFRADAGSRKVRSAQPLLVGAHDVATQAAAQGPRFAQHCQPALVNGAAGVIVRVGPTVVAVVGLTVIDHRIAEIDLILDPDKLAAVEISTG